MRLEKIGRFKASFTDYEELDAMYIILSILEAKAKKNDSSIIPAGYEYEDMFYEYKEYTLEEIALEIRKMLESIESETLREKLNDITKIQEYLSMLVMLGRIVINDVIGGSSTYKLIPRYLADSSYSRHYCNIKLENPEKILIVSDTHIGDKEKEDFELINEVFGYSNKKHNIKDAIHLGDVFHGIRLDKGEYCGYTYNSEEVQQILDEQLEKFIRYFPDYMKIIAIEGNHDTSVIEYLENYQYLTHNWNQMYFTIIKPNFHMLRKSESRNMINHNGMRISLSHQLRYNFACNDVKTYEVDNEDDFKSWFKKYNWEDIDLLLSGHFHYSLSRSIDDENGITRRRMEVVPSLSKNYKLAEDQSVAMIIRFIYDESGNITSYGIMPLYLIDNNIVEGQEVFHQTNAELLKEKPKIFQK